MDMKVVKIVNKDKKYEAKNGKFYTSCNYYLVVNGNYICIRPSFAKDYGKLDLFAEKVVNGK